MQAGKRYSFFQTVNWTRKYIFYFLIYDSLIILSYLYLGIEWLSLPWQPISLIGIAVAFYLGFKNNSAYERLWEARKIWGGIVNTSRSLTVMVRDFINNDETKEHLSETDLSGIRKTIIHRHVAWLHALTLQLRQLKKWEHDSKQDQAMRMHLNTMPSEDRWKMIRNYLSEEDFDYIMSKGNKCSHLLSIQSRHLMKLRQIGVIEHFRHLEIQSLITECYTLQGKAERIKNFPFPRQYATVNYFFVVLFILLLPLGMLNVFTSLEQSYWIWFAIPFSVVGSWVFWMMEMIGEYSENPFEGLYNDVPITSMARGIEIDIRQMIDETDLPEALKPIGHFQVLT